MQQYLIKNTTIETQEIIKNRRKKIKTKKIPTKA